MFVDVIDIRKYFALLIFFRFFVYMRLNEMLYNYYLCLFTYSFFIPFLSVPVDILCFLSFASFLWLWDDVRYK